MLSLAADGGPVTCAGLDYLAPLFNLQQTRELAAHSTFANLTLDRITTSHHTPSFVDKDPRLRIQWQQTATFTSLETGT